MEEETQKRMRKKKKKKRRDGVSPPPVPLLHPPAHTFFPQLLSACANIRNPHARSLIKRLLCTHLALVRGRTQQPHPHRQILHYGLLSLLPFLLFQTNYPDVAVLAAEMVGAVVLCSLEANEEIASDGEIVKGLVAALGSPSRRVAAAACHAVLDLSTTSIGRERLIESSAVEKVATTLVTSIRSCTANKGSNNYSQIGCMKDRFSALVLHAAVTLINACNDKFLEQIPGELSRIFLVLVKELWVRLQVSTSPSECSKLKGYVCFTKHDLAETIFRLSMNQVYHTTCTPDVVKRSMFSDKESDFEHFLLKYWEDSPFLLRRTSKNMEDGNVIFNCLNFNTKTIDAALGSILRCLISCPPIMSDELDIFSFLKEVKGALGSPMLYGQDIRLVKTQNLLSGSSPNHLKEEVHFLKNWTGLANADSSAFTDSDHVQKCKEALGDGYTIALRGLEFRSQNVAALADGLAALFGQPSVGANVYLTPPGSQGLSRHYDDHCVFVCQILGQKRWTVFPRLTPLLPRLYESLGTLPCSMGDGDVCEGEWFSLREGDILYIPRGYPHEAHTIVDASEPRIEDSTGFSLHLTLGIEVEPPFEWEGFAHAALHCWNQKQRNDYYPTISKLRIPNFMFINLLHVAIRLIGNRDPIFRKACMVTAFSSPSGSEREQHTCTLILKQRAATFGHIIDKIDANSSFLEAFKSVEAAVCERNDDSLQWMRWLRHLPQEGNENEKSDFNNPFEAFEELLQLSNGHIKEVETTFMQVKSEFCRYITFEDALEKFEMVQEKYKKVRKQYMNGMLSLHLTS